MNFVVYFSGPPTVIESLRQVMYGMYEQSRLRTAWALRMHSSQTVEIETFSVSEMRISPSYRRGIAVKYYNAKVAMAVLK